MLCGCYVDVTWMLSGCYVDAMWMLRGCYVDVMYIISSGSATYSSCQSCKCFGGAVLVVKSPQRHNSIYWTPKLTGLVDEWHSEILELHRPSSTSW